MGFNSVNINYENNGENDWIFENIFVSGITPLGRHFRCLQPALKYENEDCKFVLLLVITALSDVKEVYAMVDQLKQNLSKLDKSPLKLEVRLGEDSTTKFISSMTSKFQILSNPFRIINSGKYCTGSMNTAENPVKKWEAGINEVRIMGRLDKDPWLTTVQGKPTLYLLVGIPETSLQKDGSKTTEQNLQIVYTQNSALIRHLQYFVRKGTRVYLCGQLSCLEESNGTSINVMVTKFSCV